MKTYIITEEELKAFLAYQQDAEKDAKEETDPDTIYFIITDFERPDLESEEDNTEYYIGFEQ